ncbi:hypothetical protein [Micromonospora sp. WMMD714]|uniref:hypothetical protein n=1 Tax=Micromonospora sp. WMMD714 TaxID=3016097 RepID=UPI00249B2C73|nr:hypothetical protein [Micromonospora sp. WMMD714]WFE63333.1 hypothetical protein O7625_08565 [Micromonospora sp. WMMD714]
MEHDAPAAGSSPGTPEPARSPDRSSLVANLITAAAGLVGLVQVLRADPWWPLWVLAAALALIGLLAYRLRQRRWLAASVSLGLLLLLGGGGVLLAGTRPDDRTATTGPTTAAPAAGPATPAPTTSAPPPTGPTPTAPAPTSPAATDPDSSGPAAPATVLFSDVVQLGKKTGVELDRGRAERRNTQDADVDVYLDWGYILYSSARHSAMYDDSNKGPEQDADARCRDYREAGQQSFAHHYIGGGNQQYCFTTSEGHPGWLQAVNTLEDGGLLIKVTVWRG